MEPILNNRNQKESFSGWFEVSKPYLGTMGSMIYTSLEFKGLVPVLNMPNAKWRFRKWVEGVFLKLSQTMNPFDLVSFLSPHHPVLLVGPLMSYSAPIYAISPDPSVCHRDPQRAIWSLVEKCWVQEHKSKDVCSYSSLSSSYQPISHSSLLFYISLSWP